MTQNVAMPAPKGARTCLSRELRAILRRARQRGELPRGADVELLEQVVLGALLYLVVLRDRPLDEARLKRAVSVLLGASSPTRPAPSSDRAGRATRDRQGRRSR